MSTSQPKQELPSQQKAFLDSVQASLGVKIKIDYARPNRIRISTTTTNLEEAATLLRDKFHFDHCANVTATDFPKDKQIEVVYHFGSIDGENLRSLIFAISCRVPSNEPVVPSLFRIFPSVDLHEREMAEMLGVIFSGHPNLSRLLLPEDWNDIPPLLKAYRLPGRLESE